MIGLIIALLIGIPTFYTCLLTVAYYSYRTAKRHGMVERDRSRVDFTTELPIYYHEVEVHATHCFWCAFFVAALKSISK